MSRLVNASLHRFGDRVAISLPGKGETLYLTAEEASLLAFGLEKCAMSINTEKFTESNFGTYTVNLTNEGKR